jgi:subtilisin family serine protease
VTPPTPDQMRLNSRQAVLLLQVAAGEALRAPGREVLTLTPGGHYDFVSGSSMAAAHVTGAVALLMAADHRQFHDAFMQQGFPPIKLVRRALLHDDSPTLLRDLRVQHRFIDAAPVL